MRAGLVDELNLAFVPVLLGRGERLFESVDALTAGYECVETVAGEGVTHIRLVHTG
jgi:dihydrofolate reductase